LTGATGATGATGPTGATGATGAGSAYNVAADGFAAVPYDPMLFNLMNSVAVAYGSGGTAQATIAAGVVAGVRVSAVQTVTATKLIVPGFAARSANTLYVGLYSSTGVQLGVGTAGTGALAATWTSLTISVTSGSFALTSGTTYYVAILPITAAASLASLTIASGTVYAGGSGFDTIVGGSGSSYSNNGRAWQWSVGSQTALPANLPTTNIAGTNKFFLGLA
jgi:hypothetical protein